jgi:tetraacyldisaccharide 4'-kinase
MSFFKYPKFWQNPNWRAYLLLPLAAVFYLIMQLRRFGYRFHIFKVTKFPVPVIVIGNISVGGAGKTPFVIWLANYLKQQGEKPGIVSRGYGSKAKYYPYLIKSDSNYQETGDEAQVIIRRTECPMVIAPDRVAAVKKLLAETDCDIVISDDGLQHYALGRDREIVLVDDERRFGNGFLLPAGPLREPISRLASVDKIIVNGEDMRLVFDKKIYNVRSKISKNLTEFDGQTVHAVAGIGNPQRFFAMLKQIGIKIIPHSFPDHHQFVAKDLTFSDNLPIIMTEKDAVKCELIAGSDCWYLPISAVVTANIYSLFNFTQS